jgi:hypothetical protein
MPIDGPVWANGNGELVFFSSSAIKIYGPQGDLAVRDGHDLQKVCCRVSPAFIQEASDSFVYIVQECQVAVRIPHKDIHT